MIRTCIGLVLIIAAVLWFPVAFQMGLFVIGILLLPYRLLLLIPAVFADTLYAPMHTLSLGHFQMTLVVGGLLLVWFIIMTQTRFGTHYVSKTN